MRRCPAPSPPSRRRSRQPSTRSPSGCAPAAASSTWERARQAASPRSTRRSARRRSRPRPAPSSQLVAGGETAPPLVQAAAEDDRAGGAGDLTALDIGPGDAVVGVSASGTTPYVLGALEVASHAGALTAAVTCARDSELGALVDHEIAVVVGPEFIAGSTRLKAGTAQKLVLNTISTMSMIRLGKTYGNLMVDVVAANDKLQDRVRRIVEAATGASGEQVDDALAAADGDARVAIVSLRAGIEAPRARERLEASGRSITRALEDTP